MSLATFQAKVVMKFASTAGSGKIGNLGIKDPDIGVLN